MDANQILTQLDALEEDATLLDDLSLDARARALLVLDQVDALVRLLGKWQDLGDAQGRADKLRRRLREIDIRLYSGIRAGIRDGSLRGTPLRRRLDAFTRYRPGAPAAPLGSADDLDALLRGLMRLDEAPAGEPPRDSDAFGLEFTPGRVVLELVDRLGMGPGDVFFDLGSGLGQVVILAHLLTGAQGRGVEREASYCRFARERAAELGATGVTFLNADARRADLSEGTAFFMFSPFRGLMLEQVLGRLRESTEGGQLRLCTYGPCTPWVAREPWLRAVAGGQDPARLAVFVGQ